MPVALATDFATLWDSGDSPPDVVAYLRQKSDSSSSEKLDVLLADQQRRWQTDRPLLVEDYLAELPELAVDIEAKLQLAFGEFQARQLNGAVADLAQFATRFSDLGDTLKDKLAELIASEPNNVEDPYRTESFTPTSAAWIQRFGRYRAVRVLGHGGFGRVWLGFDDELQRQVAIKVPAPERFQQPSDAEQFLAEARKVASLDHPHIVPVYDVGSADDGSVYIVSKFIEGGNLEHQIKRDRPSYAAAAKLLAACAEALHHAHQRRLIHRDIKPANILIEASTATPYVADFGLAISEEDYLRDGHVAGTPGYMSPEQARGEGHRLDGRSDIFSLGAVLYEVLTGRRPFRGSTHNELHHQVISIEPTPPREIDASIPVELERICLKALAKRVSDRYATAAELADDLLHWQQGPEQPAAEQKIIPKGLRSFDADDADFFLELLPGPRNRAGLPESIQFWKSRIEATDHDQTFSVGLLYGPSGCGKSSLVKAGLLPGLSAQVIAIYLEATPGETETRLLRGLKKHLPELPDDLGLVESFAASRRMGKKVLIVLDQFEQWLHAHRTEQNTELVNALRQCDGVHVQAIVMVRDDFGMAASRFMDALDIPIIQGRNFATVDLFDIDHAQKVLTKFGQAFGKLPAQSANFSLSETEFVQSVACGLAADDKVVSVRLALFAEMVKGKPWIPATLEAVGGAQGVGVNFLEETFSSRSANPKHRLHQQAARAVLKSLLPEVGADIKGHMRSHEELLAASGYQQRPSDFNELLRILDGELRLITPTDPEGFQSDSDNDPNSKYYQLTHDYLVPALRQWLTRKQRETRRGRAELRLAHRAALWHDKPENRHLPSLWEYLNIRLLTKRKTWTPVQGKMMRRAARVLGLRSALAPLLLTALIAGGWEISGRTRANSLVEQLAAADIAEVPKIVEKMAGYRRWADPLLRQADAQAEAGSKEKLYAALALLPVDESQVNYLRDQLLVVTPTQFPVVCDALLPHKNSFIEPLWSVALDSKRETQQRFQAACALATYAPADNRWTKIDKLVAGHLITLQASDLVAWREALRPAKSQLVAPLAAIYRNPTLQQQQRSFATETLADYLADQPEALVDLLADAEQFQFPGIFAKLPAHQSQAIALAKTELAKRAGEKAGEDEKERIAKRQANVAVALLRMGRPDDAWPLLKLSPDPRVRSYLIHWIGPLRVDSQTIIQRLDNEPDVTIRRALILSLGEFTDAQLPVAGRQRLIENLLAAYENDPDPGLHGAAEWLLRKWGLGAKLAAINDKLRANEERIYDFVSAPLNEIQKLQLAALSKNVDEVQTQLNNRDVALWEAKLRAIPASPESLQKGLIAHYPFDEGDGTTIPNAVPGQPEATYQGEGKPAWLPGVLGHALRLDGNATVVGPQPLDLECDQPFSYGCWFQYDGKFPMVLLSTRDRTSGFRGFDLSLEKGSQLRMQIAGEPPDVPAEKRSEYNSGYSPNFISVIAETNVNPARFPGWHHVLISYDGSKNAAGVSIFVDGHSQPTRVLEDKFVGTMKGTAPLYIGSRHGDYKFRGLVADVRIYNRRLDEKEAQQLVDAGVRSVASIPLTERTPEQRQLLAAVYSPRDEQLSNIERRLDSAKESLQSEHDMERDWLRHWYINMQGQTFAIIEGGEFTMGSPEPEPGQHSDESPHRVQIGRRFAISTTHVTKAQFAKFHAARPNVAHMNNGDWVKTDDSPQTAMTWYEAAEYCNWLSEQEGIAKEQWCYEPNEKGDYGPAMKPKEKYLELSGYRLPTEAEWEYACRAGTATSRYYGGSESLLAKYAWYLSNAENRTWPVASLKPNDFGLFDMHGNAWQWCHDAYQADPEAADSGRSAPVVDTASRVLRGGSFRDQASNVRSPYRVNNVPAFRYYFYGFRAARTLTAE